MWGDTFDLPTLPNSVKIVLIGKYSYERRRVMGSFVNRGNNSFTNARKSQIYIDKTGFLKYINSVLDTEQSYICVSKPRRFGKTMTAGMLTAYYSKGCDSLSLFEDLEIAKSDSVCKHLNQ